MQQYFTDISLNIGEHINLDKDTLFHIQKVLRKTDGYLFRIVDSTHTVYLVELSGNSAVVKDRLDENRETGIEITAIIALIKNDHFELCLQKLTELGVTRFVPYEAERSVVKGSSRNKEDRYQKIVREASEQCLRNIIPEVCKPIGLKEIDKYRSELNLLPYEKEDAGIFEDLNSASSITFIIGPEGGFTENEVTRLKEMGFKSISLGRRILRAETAAICMASLISGGKR